MNKIKKVALIIGNHWSGWIISSRASKGYKVHGILRRSSSFNTARIEHLYLNEWVRDMKKDRLVNLHYGDMTDSSSLIRIIQQVQPDDQFQGDLRWDSSKPDGTMRKLTDVSKLQSLGWHHKVEINEGIHRLYEWYLRNI